MTVRIVLVEPKHPGNIGAAARAMKNMGLRELSLVRPQSFPDPEASARASGADDVLAAARVHQDLGEAIADCGLIVGTSARPRHLPWDVVEPRECAARIVQAAGAGGAAIVFGCERFGLSNEELAHCNLLVTIPTHPQYCSLNLAMAVQVLTYELWLAMRPGAPPAAPLDVPLASAEEMGRLYEHIEQVLAEIDFRDRTGGGHLMARIRRLFNRANLDQNEMNILRGILSAVQSRRRPAGGARSAPGETVDRAIYLDYAATTPVDPRVAEAMIECLRPSGEHGNPSSMSHDYGRRARALIERARAQVAAAIGAKPECIVWTSGATESNNLALFGTARSRADRGRHIVSARTEHKAVIDPLKQLEREGFEVTWLKPGTDGIVRPEQVAAALRADTRLVSLMHVNNEIGVIQDVGAVGRLCRERGIAFHVDAAQSAGKLELDVEALCIDLLSLTAHKIYGPKGVGALYVRKHPPLELHPLFYGGGQERGLRSGTLATHQIVGMGAAFEIAARERTEEAARLAALRERLWSGIAALGAVELNGHREARVAGLLNVSFRGIEGESLQFALRELAVSAGAACSSASDEASYVLRALGRSDELAQSSLRFSLGRFTRQDEIDAAIAAITREVTRLRALAPPVAQP